MARPLKRTVDYFPHFVTAGKTLLILQNEFGNDGYAFWFKLLSLLCKTDGQVYDYNNPAAWRLLLAETCVNEDIANRVLTLLSEIEAIDPALYLKKIIWVQNLVDNLGEVYTRRRDGSVPEKPVIVDKNPVNATRKPQTRLDHTKLNHTKEDIPIKQKFGEFLNVFLTPGEHEKLVNKFGAAGAGGWIESLSTHLKSVGKPRKYADHYATILTWARREEGKSGANRGHNKTGRELPTTYKTPEEHRRAGGYRQI